MTKKKLLLLGVRFLLVNAVYLSVKLTMDHGEEGVDWFSPTAMFYYITAFILLMSTWELNDALIKKAQKKRVSRILGRTDHFKIMIFTMLVILPLAAILYYLGIFTFNQICEIDAKNPWLRWRVDFLRAFLIGMTVIFFNQFYNVINQKKELENKMLALRQELITSKYTSLKHQISPHFLFNSLNTLTSLMYEDRDLASDFVTRLASCYRYILDYREEDLVSLQIELNFLDSFIFMMNVRHQDALRIKTDIDVDATNCVIPTLTLQMLVENALKHNYYSKERPMEIIVRSKGKQRLVIENTYRKRVSKEESTGLGIKNIQKRYAFYTQQEVIVEQTDSLFTIEIPLLPKNLKEVKTLSIS